jgi:hypothetical protein
MNFTFKEESSLVNQLKAELKEKYDHLEKRQLEHERSKRAA